MLTAIVDPEAVSRPLLSGMIVEPSHRRRGVTSAILRRRRHRRRHGADEELNVQRSNCAATELYRRSGYCADSDAGECADVDSLSWWDRWRWERSYVLLRKELAPGVDGIEACGSASRSRV